MKLTPKTSFYGLLALLLVVLAVVVASLYWSKSQLDQRSETIDEKRQQTAELDSKIDAAIKLRQELEVKSELVTVTEEILPSSKSQENIVGELIDIAANRGLKLASIAFSGAQSSADPETSQTEKVDGLPGVFSLNVTTSIETDYENVLQFLEDLENNKRQFEVTSLSISPNEGSQFTVSLSIVTYIKP
jgi:Tfp pilus assembly protein PilO